MYKVNTESRANVNNIMKSVKQFEEMLIIWTNNTRSEDNSSPDSFMKRFDLKRKKLKDFLSAS